jgi:hypothetical protein
MTGGGAEHQRDDRHLALKISDDLKVVRREGVAFEHVRGALAGAVQQQEKRDPFLLSQHREPEALGRVHVADGSALDGEVLRDYDDGTAVHASHAAHQGIGGHRLSSGWVRSAAQRADLLERSLIAQACHPFPRVQATLRSLTRQPLGPAHRGGGIRSALEIVHEIVPTVVSSYHQSVPLPRVGVGKPLPAVRLIASIRPPRSSCPGRSRPWSISASGEDSSSLLLEAQLDITGLFVQ